jgi:hypothetical protein
MQCPRQDRSLGTSRLLQLPREIRDLIYEHVLVRDAIPIECAITKPSSGQVSEAFDDLSSVYPLRAPRNHRRIWPMPASDLGTAYSNIDKPATVYMTYQITQQMEMNSKNGINLHLLQVCKQIHAEARGVFYSRNVFSFTGDYRIPTAFTFLCDRPAVSLLLIRSLEIALMEDNNMWGTPHARFPMEPMSASSVVLQFAYHYFTELCTLLSTPRIQLRRLYLTVEIMIRPEEGFSREMLSSEAKSMTGRLDFLPAWFDPLLSIQKLQEIELCWISRRPWLQNMAYAASAMQHRMLAGRQNDGEVKMVGHGDCPAPSRFCMLHKSESDSLSDSDASWVCEDLVVDVDGLRHAQEDKSDEEKGLECFVTRPHLVETLEPYTDVYACYWKLERA